MLLLLDKLLINNLKNEENCYFSGSGIAIVLDGNHGIGPYHYGICER